MPELRDTAIQYLEEYIEAYQECPIERAQHSCQSRISFAKQLGLITNSEAATYCRRVGLENIAMTYDKFAAIRGEETT